MKAAFAIWNQRIAPVFDVARTIQTVTVGAGGIEQAQQSIRLSGPPLSRVAHLKQNGVDILICGAVSQALHHLLVANGIQVIAFVAGEFNEVCQAWLDGTLENAFAMPGCGARRRLRCATGGNKESMMQAQGGAGRRTGGGGGQHAGRGRRGGNAAGPVGECVCPQCGNRQPHERGVPCTQKKCNQCGAAMVRQ